MRVCTAAQMRELDRRTIEEYGVPSLVLMECAGRGVADLIRRERGASGQRVVVLCGAGNNGGDGFVAARHLASAGAQVTTYLVGSADGLTPDARVNLQILERLGADLRTIAAPEELDAEETIFASATVIVDALLGTGLRSEVRDPARRTIERANRCRALRVAVDIPSGLDADTGAVLGVAFAADHTVTFGYPKVALVSHPGCERVGRLQVVDIGIPRQLEERATFAAELLEEAGVAPRLAARPAWGHKGTHGHLLVVAGSPGKTGAALLCGEAVLRSGAGLCTIAAPAPALAALECKTRELMLTPLLPEGAEPSDSDDVFAHLLAQVAGKAAVALGPGIPRGEGMARLIARLVRESPVPLVIDADGLNELAPQLPVLAEARVPVLLTPHPGEMATLTGSSVDRIQADRLGVATAFAQQHGVYLALKGARTIVASPDGRAFINPTGNAGLGSAGTGDVLTGLVGGLVAQKNDPLDALLVGVYVHGLAGDRAAARLGGRGMLAGDLLVEVGRVLKDLEA
ncbi:MAG: NAD(P)H-hydrate dehydratase [Deltaproteobacteria bacterium]|nr:NAD(P)H-hydrate dehydratase [Deltaproteobacteria bacterium]